MVIQLENGKPIGYPILESNFKQIFPEITFPAVLTPANVEPLGYGMYDFSQIPEPGTYEKVIEIDPVKDDRGIWRQTWEVVPMTPEEVVEKNEKLRQQTKQQASYLLTQTDWTQIPDVNDPTNPPYLINKVDFTAYRAEVRAIALNPPVTVNEWPTKPEEVWSTA